MINKNKVEGMGDTILVSGATGTVGSEVVKQLSSHTDINIKAAGRSIKRIKHLEGDKVKTVGLDYNKLESMKETSKDVDNLFLHTPDVPNVHELALIWSMKQRRLELDIL
jgi:uncharacterized protein YbjT (DUF2867 family)